MLMLRWSEALWCGGPGRALAFAGVTSGDLVASLMHRHEVAAERRIGWLRVTIGICIFVTVIGANNLLRQWTGVSLDLFEHNAWIASLGFLVIGAVSIVLAVPQRWHHGLAYLFMVLDIGLVLVIAVFAVGERGLPGNALPSARSRGRLWSWRSALCATTSRFSSVPLLCWRSA